MSVITKVDGFLTSSHSAAATMPIVQTALGPDGPLSARQIELVQFTWQRIMLISTQAGSLFYDNLFTFDPEMKYLFARTELPERQKKLVQTMTMAVNDLSHLHERALGNRDDLDDTAEAALLLTLKQVLGADYFTPEVEEAWTTAYSLLAAPLKTAVAGLSVV